MSTEISSAPQDSSSAAAALSANANTLTAPLASSKELRITNHYRLGESSDYPLSTLLNVGSGSERNFGQIGEQIGTIISKMLEPVFTLIKSLSSKLSTALSEKTALAEKNAALEKSNTELTQQKTELEEKLAEATKVDPGTTDLKPTTNSDQMRLTEGFLWKPKSDNDSKLVILLPERLQGEVKKVRILSPDGKELAVGKYSGIGNGNRDHYRFDKAGGSYADGSVVEITLKDGRKKTVTIKETSARFEPKDKSKKS